MTEALIQTGNKIFILLLSMFLVSCGPTSSQPDDLNSSIAIEHVTIIDAKHGLQEDMTVIFEADEIRHVSSL